MLTAERPCQSLFQRIPRKKSLFTRQLSVRVKKYLVTSVCVTSTEMKSALAYVWIAAGFTGAKASYLQAQRWRGNALVIVPF